VERGGASPVSLACSGGAQETLKEDASVYPLKPQGGVGNEADVQRSSLESSEGHRTAGTVTYLRLLFSRSGIQGDMLGCWMTAQLDGEMGR
jgi:hypothetical protein